MSHSRALFDLVIGGLIFCLGGILVKYVNMTGVGVAFWRLFIAAVGLFLLTRNTVSITARERIFGALSGFFLSLDLMLWHESVYAIGPGVATVINNVQVFFGAFLGIWLFKEKLTTRMLVFLVVAIIGIAMIASDEVGAEEVENLGTYGIITGVVSALMYALALLCLKPLNQHPSQGRSGKATFLRLAKIMREGAFTGAVTCGVTALMFEQSLAVPNVEAWILLLIYGMVTHVLGWALITRALPLLPIALAGLILMTEPIVMVLLDMAIYAKSITARQWLGIVVTLTSVYFGSRSRS